MNRCSVNGDVNDFWPSISSGEKFMKLGLYEERHYEALCAFILLVDGLSHAPEDYPVKLKFDGYSFAMKMLLFADGYNVSEHWNGSRLAFNYAIAVPNGEIVLLGKDTPDTTKEELVKDLWKLAKLVRSMCENNRVDYTTAEFTVMYTQEEERQEYRFSYTSLLDLAAAVEAGCDDGKPNDPIVTERNMIMTREFARLARAVFDVDSMIFQHKLFKMNLCYKNFKFDVGSVMTPLKDIDRKLHDSILEFLDQVDIVQPFVEDRHKVVHRLFWKFY